MNLLWINIVALWIVLLFVLLLVLMLIRNANQNNPQNKFDDVETLTIGEKAPDFSAISIDGIEMTLLDFIGKETVFIFMKLSCTPCIERISEIEAVRKDAENANVNLVYVCDGEGDKSSTDAIFEGIDLQKATILLIDKKNNSMMKDYKVPATPFFCYLDKNGIVEDTWFLDQRWENIVKNWQHSLSNNA